VPGLVEGLHLDDDRLAQLDQRGGVGAQGPHPQHQPQGEEARQPDVAAQTPHA